MPRTRQVLILVPCLLALAACCFWFRRATIRTFFIDGPRGPAPLLTQPQRQIAGLAHVPRVRVVLIDGLSLAAARGLPFLNRACSEGTDAVVDTGFPTVSLPVQHVLWTGLTQSQAGVMYRIAPLPFPPPGGLPVAMSGSVGVAESHNEIVKSFGFAHVMAPVGARATTPEQLTWRQVGFATAAAEAVASAASLAFVHVLAVDEAGHATGGASSRYRAAAVAADTLLSQMLTAQPDREGTRWFVLSDHGHRRAGGHADAEPHIRLVRLCVFGAGVAPLRSVSPVHLVDVHRALADSLGVVPQPGSAGRPWAFALKHPDHARTLPAPGALRWTLALAVLLCALAATHVNTRHSLALGPWWLLLSSATLLWERGDITLSNPVVYPPLGLSTAQALIPGLLLLAIQAAWALRRMTPLRMVAALAALPVGLLLASASLCGAAETLVGLRLPPPLVPRWSAVFSVTATACVAASLVLALVLALLQILSALSAAKRSTISR